MSRQIVVDILGDASKFTKATKDAARSAQSFGAQVKEGIGQGIGIGVTQMAARATDAVVGFMTDSVKAASNLNETLTKSEVIFKDNAVAVEAWGEKAADAMGLSERAAIDAASGFAGLFKTVGIGLDESTQMSQKLTGLGSDLASFFNTDMATALAALKSGLNGESEPLRAFNVFLSETAVNAKLAQMGIDKVNGRFTEAQKATARYALILEQTGDAQGDFARTSDGLANSTRTLDAKIENLQARLGQSLTPVLADATQKALGLMDALDSESPMTLADRLINLGDVARALNPMMWATNTATGAMEDKMDAAAAEAAEAARSMDTFAEANANAREPTRNFTGDNKRLAGSLRLVAQSGAAALEAVQAQIDALRELDYINSGKPKGKPGTQSGVPKGSGPSQNADGGWVGLNGPELSWLGEKGPEYVIPNHQLGKAPAPTASGPKIVVNVAGSIIGPSGVDELMDIMARRLRLDGV